MSIKIDRFSVQNKQRGSATILASFDVNLGPITIRGYEIVRVGDKTFISEPANVYKKSDGSGWDRFSYIVYAGAKGEQLQGEIQRLAFEEMRRRSQATAPSPSFGSDNDSGLPF